MAKNTSRRATRPVVNENLFSMWMKILLSALGFFLIYSSVFVLALRWLSVPSTAFIQIKTDKDSSVVIKHNAFSYKWTPIDRISDNFKLSVIASEDQKFFTHSGFDLQAIEEAMDRNEKKKNSRGASTISQQVAKNMFLWPDKSLARKSLEAYYTVLIEHIWGKKRILEYYVNIVELGYDIYGAEAASREFFGTGASGISPSQAALLTAVLPNPEEYSVRNPSSYVLRRQRRILNQMRLMGGTEFLRKNLL